MSSEFELIRRYCTQSTHHTYVSVGDDAALFGVRPGFQVAVSTDVLVEGVHFFSDVDPYLLGKKAAAVNLSDMAAMGATPRWVTLGLTLPNIQEPWLESLCRGFHDLLSQHQVDWVGGDTTRGPLNLAVTIMGELPLGQALLRSQAQTGDDIWVSGTLGDAAMALGQLTGKTLLSDEEFVSCRRRLEDPTPRLELGQGLLSLAHSAIDISDGMLADLNHVLEASRVGARIDVASLPLSSMLAKIRQDSFFWSCVLAGGDDYELCFTASPLVSDQIHKLAQNLGVKVTQVGVITDDPRERQLINAPQSLNTDQWWTGYDHFRTTT